MAEAALAHTDVIDQVYMLHAQQALACWSTSNASARRTPTTSSSPPTSPTAPSKPPSAAPDTVSSAPSAFFLRDLCVKALPLLLLDHA